MRFLTACVACIVAGGLTACGDEEPSTSLVSLPPASSCPADLPATDLVASAIAAPRCEAEQYDLHRDVAYTSGPDGLLDLLVPRNSTTARPVVIWVHGGGWQSGDKADRAQADRLACRGFAVASINYRLSDTAIFPAQIHDVKAAIRFLRAQASLYGLDPGRIAIFGSSAGGHLAALAGTSGGVAALEDPAQGNAAVSSRVQAVVDWYGPTRLSAMDEQLLAQGCATSRATHGDSDSAESRLLGCTLSDASCAAQAALADPAQYADAADPPMLLMHGSADCISPTAQSTVLAAAATAAGSCAVMRTVVGAAHGGPEWQSAEVQQAAADFLSRILAP